MNKELTPLQALKTIILGTNVDTYRSSVEEIDNAISIIETALKENEKLKECYKNELKNSACYNNLALKYKKALEIIKEKILDMDYFNIIAEHCDLTYQEYELLKEILK